MEANIWKEWIKQWIKSNATNSLRIIIVLLFLGLAIWAISLLHFDMVIANREPWFWFTTALVSVSPELAGIVIAVVTIDYLNERRQTEQLKAQLIRQMGMNIRDVAVSATRELAHHGWLYDGSLSGAHLVRANLSGASLWGANLSEANLIEADLSRAIFGDANLSGAFLIRADLSGAIFEEANLSGADLGVNLGEAYLARANLSGTNLMANDLTGANLAGVNLSKALLLGVNLCGTYLIGADLSGASLWVANLSGAKGWTIEQFQQANTLEGTLMPDEVRIGWEGTEYREPIDGPTFEEWKARYLSKNGGTVTDIRDRKDELGHSN